MTEAIHTILNVMSAKAPNTTLSRTVPHHPTVSDLISRMLQEVRLLE
ncbi:hypothetical protein ABFA25_11630 [Mycobacterium lepromatosis]